MEKHLDWFWRSNTDTYTFQYSDLYGALSSSGTLLTAGMGSSITEVELGSGVSTGLVPTSWTQQLRSNALNTLTEYQFYSQSPPTRSVIDLSSSSSNPIAGNTTTASLKSVFWNYLHFKGNSGTGSQTGFRWYGASGPSAAGFSLFDVVFQDLPSIVIQLNGASPLRVESVSLNSVRTFGADVDNEAVYLGETSTTNYLVIGLIQDNNSFYYLRGWDGFQVNSCEYIAINNHTVYDCGRSATSGQKSLLRIQNVTGYINNCLYYKGAQSFTIAGRGIVITNCAFYADEAGLIQDVIADAGYASPIGTGDIEFVGCYFDSPNALAYAVEVREDNVNVTFTNCKIGNNITTLVFDNRVDKVTYDITETGTTVYDLPDPQITNVDPDDYDNHGKTLTQFYNENKIGFRNNW